MGKQFWIDTVLGTIFVFTIMAVSYKTLASIKALEPVAEALSDFEITDLVFSELREDPKVDDRIVVVNIGELPRAAIAEMIRTIQSYNPKVIGLNIDLSQESEESIMDDLVLAETISQYPNMVLSSKLATYDEKKQEYRMLIKPNENYSFEYKSGFNNLFTDDNKGEAFKTIRNFPTKRKIEGGEEIAFAIRIIEAYDPAMSQDLLARGNSEEVINFRGNVFDPFGMSSYSGMFYALDWMDIVKENFADDLIEDKIVIMGFLGNFIGDTNWDNKVFTPLNVDNAGKSNPDMYPTLVHANIAAMILNKDYIETLTTTTSIIIAIILCYLNVLAFCWVYYKLDLWYDAITKIVQLIEVLILLSIIIFAFSGFAYKLNLTLAIIAVLLSGDALEVLFGFVKNIFGEEGKSIYRKTKDYTKSKVIKRKPKLQSIDS
jgi:CHASE2 domain-containing sensor protein